jgi:adenylosuccinate synthase
LGQRGKEFGVTTGRKRRVGWFDVNVLKYSHMVNGFSSIRKKMEPYLQAHFLLVLKIWQKWNVFGKLYQGIYLFYDNFSWESDISGITEWNKLPLNARKYVERIEELIEVPVTWIGVGPDRKNTIMKPM